MSFMKNGIMFWERQIGIVIAVAAGISILAFDITLLSFFSIPLILLLGLLVIDHILPHDIITISKDGISCHHGKTCKWNYRWSEIEELQIGNRFRNPSVEVVLKSNCAKRMSFDIEQCYFQLGIKAKKAIRQYYMWPIPRRK